MDPKFAQRLQLECLISLLGLVEDRVGPLRPRSPRERVPRPAPDPAQVERVRAHQARRAQGRPRR